MRQALQHYQQSIKHEEARGDIYAAGQTRYNIALLLERYSQIGDALLYARAAFGQLPAGRARRGQRRRRLAPADRLSGTAQR
jgi:hypothetical protein